jgi:hypothetical protein
MDFWRTVMGTRFIEGTVPALVRAIQDLATAVARLATAVEKMNKEDERG